MRAVRIIGVPTVFAVIAATSLALGCKSPTGVDISGVYALVGVPSPAAYTLPVQLRSASGSPVSLVEGSVDFNHHRFVASFKVRAGTDPNGQTEKQSVQGTYEVKDTTYVSYSGGGLINFGTKGNVRIFRFSSMTGSFIGYQLGGDGPFNSNAIFQPDGDIWIYYGDGRALVFRQ